MAALEDEIRLFLIRQGIQESVLTDTIRIYRDGQIVSQTDTLWGTSDGSLPDFKITASPDGDGYNKYITDNIKIWDYAKKDFSDRFIEGPVEEGCVFWNKLNTAELSNDCVLWNTLSSLGDIATSKIGSNGVVTQPITFSAVQFGDGVKGGDLYTDSKVVFPNVMPGSVGCIEFWVRQDCAVDDGSYNVMFNAYEDYFSGTNYSFILGIFGGTDPNTLILNIQNDTTGDYIDYRGSFTRSAGEVYHIAISWNTQAAAGEKVKIYMDGSDLGYTPFPGRDNALTLPAGGNLYINKNTPTSTWNSFGYINNVKVWNYFKTDFSDRYNQSTTNIIHSEIGDDGTINGDIRFEPVKFDNGVVRYNTSSSVDFPPNVLWTLKNQGCIEFWLKPKVAQPIPYNSGVFGLINGPYVANGEIMIYWGDTVSGQGLQGGIQFGGWSGTPPEPQQWIANPGQSYHIAMTWDNSGIDGRTYITIPEMLRSFYLLNVSSPDPELTTDDLEVMWLQEQSGITDTFSAADLWYRWLKPIYGDLTVEDLKMKYYVNN